MAILYCSEKNIPLDYSRLALGGMAYIYTYTLDLTANLIKAT